MLTIQGRLVDSKGRSFQSHTVTTSLLERLDLEGPDKKEPIWRPSQRTSPVGIDGRFVLELPERASIKDPVAIKVRAPDGQVLAEREYLVKDLPDSITFDVEAKEPFEVTPIDDPALGRRVKLTGLVLDAAGKRKAANTQVILRARPVGGAADVVALVATTDLAGHFSGDYPRGEFEAAFGEVAAAEGGPIPIRLEGRVFPRRVVLVTVLVELPTDEDECHCRDAAPRVPDVEDLTASPSAYSTDLGGGRCVDLTVPNRTLEEFSYYSVVRTTDPQIKGLTPSDPPGIPPGLVTRLLDGPALALKRVDNPGLEIVAEPGLKATAIATKRIARVNPRVLKVLASDPDGFTPAALMTAERMTYVFELSQLLESAKKRVPGRDELTAQNPVDWDDTPTFYQAATIAHGHLLHFKQVWKADGYSLGDLLYSLPLAPCQKKQIAIVDWDRREFAARAEQLEEEEHLAAMLSRDRDISEIVNSTLTERVRGGSEANTWAAGGGFGLALGPLVLGGGGGSSGASSTAWQNSSRGLAASSLQQLRDRTLQSASAVRSQRSTVVQTVRQGETMRVQTEVVANQNHCHAITVEYFEVLRHFQVLQELADVQECLFIPLLLTYFDYAKTQRWRESLSRFLRQRGLRGGFDAIERILSNYVGSDLPTGRYSEETIEDLDGELRMSFSITRPPDQNDQFDPNAWTAIAALTGKSVGFWYDLYLRGQAEKDRIFQDRIAPRIAEAFVQSLRLYVVDQTNGIQQVDLDPTLVSNYAENVPLYVSLRSRGTVPPWRREDVKKFLVRTSQPLPTYSKVIVNSGSVRYRTRHLSHFLFRDYRVMNDLSITDDVFIPTPLDRQELRNPREEDKELARRLVAHLNEHVEWYHKVIWWNMDSDRRFMLLDGFTAPNSNGRSVASVVENRMIGIMGNCLIMPVAPGFHLDPTYRQDVEKPVDLLNLYAPNTPIPPMRISVPTRGVFAEAVMGSCNSCEVKEEDRFWRSEESPCSGEPTPIQPVSTESRRAEPPDLQPTPFPTPMINLQNAPAAPDPTGLAAALQLLGTPNLFRDITGLEANQRNALAAFQAAMGTAQFFGGEASKLALQRSMSRDVDKAVKTIQNAEKAGLINKDQASQLTESALRGMIGGGTQAPAQPMTTGEVEQLTNTAGANDASVSVSRPGGETVSVDAQPAGGLEQQLGRTIIILSDPQNSPDSRSFFSSRRDKAGVIEVAAVVRNAPSGATHRWTRTDVDAMTIDSQGSLRTLVRGLKSGLHELDFTVFDGSGTPIASQKLQLCIPQFVTIDEGGNTSPTPFEDVLNTFQLLGRKDDILEVARQVCDQLLSTSNVRTIWRVGPFSETVPAHLPATHVTALTLHGEPPAGRPGLAGITNQPGGAAGAAVLNETIDIFPGAFDNPVPSSDINTEVLALLVQIESQGMTAALEAFAIQVIGRLLGMTMSHEIVHSLLAFDIPSGHNVARIPGDLMNNGFDLTFTETTGFEDTAHVSPVDPANFIDHGIGQIARLQAVNQGLMDARFPVPPAFT